MNYKNIYDQLTSKCKERGLDKSKLTGYFESHHITPKCLGGDDSKDNLVLFTAREHVIAHKLLWKSYPENISLMWAYKRTVNSHKGLLTSREVEYAKTKFADYMSNRVISEETKNKISKTLTGRKVPQEVVEKRRKSMTGQKRSEETIENLKQAWVKRKEKGWTHSEESRAKISAAGKGRVDSEETRKKKSVASKGRPLPENTKIAASAYQKSLKPWEKSGVKFNTYRLYKWLHADYFYDMWIFAGKPKSKKFRSFVNDLDSTEYKVDYFQTIVDLFISGWIPEEDNDWLNRFRSKVND